MVSILSFFVTHGSPVIHRSVPSSIIELDKDLLSLLCVLGTGSENVDLGTQRGSGGGLGKEKQRYEGARGPNIEYLFCDRVWRSAHKSTDTYMEFRRRVLGIVHARQS